MTQPDLTDEALGRPRIHLERLCAEQVDRLWDEPVPEETLVPHECGGVCPARYNE